MHPWIKSTQGCSNKDRLIIKEKKEMIGFFFPSQRYDIIIVLIKCVY